MHSTQIEIQKLQLFFHLQHFSFMWFMIKVTLGEHNRCNLKSEPESRYVLRVISQRFNRASYDADIALLRLNDRVPINLIIRPICLPGRRGILQSIQNFIFLSHDILDFF